MRPISFNRHRFLEVVIVQAMTLPSRSLNALTGLRHAWRGTSSQNECVLRLLGPRSCSVPDLKHRRGPEQGEPLAGL